MSSIGFTTRDSVNQSDPRQHLSWMFVNLPGAGGHATVGHPSMFEDWSERLVKAGAYDIEWIIDEYADDNGIIKVEDLPRRKIRFDPPLRGNQTTLNASGQWVDVEAPEPDKMVIPDLNQMTPEEIGGILMQAKELGYVGEAQPVFDTAKVE